jgi:hypothetical protein
MRQPAAHVLPPLAGGAIAAGPVEQPFEFKQQ